MNIKTVMFLQVQCTLKNWEMDIHLNFDLLAVTARRPRQVNLHGHVINEEGDPDTAEVFFFFKCRERKGSSVGESAIFL